MKDKCTNNIIGINKIVLLGIVQEVKQEDGKTTIFLNVQDHFKQVFEVVVDAILEKVVIGKTIAIEGKMKLDKVLATGVMLTGKPNEMLYNPA